MGYCYNDVKIIVRDHIPLEQGLRLATCSGIVLDFYVRDHIPLEQGLRLNRTSDVKVSTSVRDHIPLEQGLRHFFFHLLSLTVSRQRPYSIRTRIKTRLSISCMLRSMSETIFH